MILRFLRLELVDSDVVAPAEPGYRDESPYRPPHRRGPAITSEFCLTVGFIRENYNLQLSDRSLVPLHVHAVVITVILSSFMTTSDICILSFAVRFFGSLLDPLLFSRLARTDEEISWNNPFMMLDSQVYLLELEPGDDRGFDIQFRPKGPILLAKQ